MNKKETGLPIKVKKTDRFFAFYKNKGFYQLWLLCFILSVFILCELDVPMLLIELGGIIVSTIASLLIFGVIIMTSDISEGESHGMNSRNSSRVSNQSGKGRYSAQTVTTQHPYRKHLVNKA